MVPAFYMPCVYIATNTVNGSIYIGKTMMGLPARVRTHFSRARNNPSEPFTHAIRKHGENAFAWDILYVSDDEEALFEAEISLIAAYKSAGYRLYNATDGGAGSARIRPQKEKDAARKSMSEAAKQRMRDAWTPKRKAEHAITMSKRKMTDQQRLDISKRMTGKRMSDASIAKMAATKTGKKMAPWSEERRAKMAAARDRGCFIKTHEHKAKIAEAKRARITDDERARLSELGKKGAAKRWGP